MSLLLASCICIIGRAHSIRAGAGCPGGLRLVLHQGWVEHTTRLNRCQTKGPRG